MLRRRRRISLRPAPRRTASARAPRRSSPPGGRCPAPRRNAPPPGRRGVTPPRRGASGKPRYRGGGGRGTTAPTPPPPPPLTPMQGHPPHFGAHVGGALVIEPWRESLKI